MRLLIFLFGLFYLISVNASQGFVVEKAYNGESISISTVSPDRAKWIHQKLAGLHLPFTYLVNGCHVRAQEMTDIASIYQINMAKVVVEGNLTYRVPNEPWIVNWTYHMAPVISVENKGLYVIDPSFFSEPVSLDTWKDHILKDSSNSKVESYFISANTFRPSLKNQTFQMLPRKIDRSMPLYISQFSSDLAKYGRYDEKCYSLDSAGVKTVGGLHIPDIPAAYRKNFPNCLDL